MSQPQQPHSFTQAACLHCHQQDQNNNITTTDYASTTCLDCHSKTISGSYMHPYDITPKATVIPADFPLSQDGLLTCSTCHNIHQAAPKGFGGTPAFLRRSLQGKAFCDCCHGAQQSATNSAFNQHQGMLLSAHLEAESSAITTYYGIDPLSRECLSCHDGSLGQSISLSTGIWQHQNNLIAHDAGVHPIGMDYEEIRLQSPRSNLRPMSELDPRIRLFEGKVGCGSCHNPYSHIDKSLVMSNYQSALCFSCHALNGSN